MENELDKAIQESERVGDLFGGLLNDIGTGIPESLKDEKEKDPEVVSKDIDDVEKRLRERLKDIEKGDQEA